jgi:hypothetical protein
MKIIIPSYKRPGINPSLDNLPHEIVEKYVYLAVRNEEYDEYVLAHPNVKIHNLGDGVDGILETRQRINEQFTGKIMIIDDDNIFHQTNIKSKKKDPEDKYIQRGIQMQSVEEFEEMLSFIDKTLDDYSLGTMRNLNFIRGLDWLPYAINKVCYWVYFINLDTFKYEDCNFRNGPKSGLCEDLYLYVDWFDKGNDFFTLAKWNVNETSKMNGMTGGCNFPERGIKYKHSLEELHKMFTHHSSLVKSKKNTETFGFEVPTLKIRLNAKKRMQKLGVLF